MAGRKRLPIGTLGEITVQKVAVRKCRASSEPNLPFQASVGGPDTASRS